MTESAKSKSPEVDPRFGQVSTAQLKHQGVEHGRMFGSDGLKISGKVFAMQVNGALVVKLPADRAQGLVSAKQAKLFDPGHGRPMKEWVSFATGTAQAWLALADESRKYVAALEAKKAKK
jgi:TfoX/Sxy family transcriptional regulator of competence genes